MTAIIRFSVIENELLSLEQEFPVSRFKEGFKKPDLMNEFNLID